VIQIALNCRLDRRRVLSRVKSGNRPDGGLAAAAKQGMRGLLIFLIVAGLGFLYWWQKEHATSPAPGKPAAAQSVQAQGTPAPLTPAPRGQASKYNFMKRDLDRARDVVDQSRKRLKEAQDPAP
jgi:hypothetical protein